MERDAMERGAWEAPPQRWIMSRELGDLIEQAQAARSEGQPDIARTRWLSAIKLARGVGDLAALVKALNGLAQIERDEHRSDRARPYYEEAITVCREAGQLLALAHTLRHLGDHDSDDGRLEIAEQLYIGKPWPLAILCGRIGKTDEARLCFSDAIAIYARLNIGEGVSECSALRDQLGDGPN